MSAEPRPTPSLLVRFFDSFLQERNIKWMLALGMLLLLGSSLCLAAMHWHQCAPVWKYVVLLGYAVLLFGAGEWLYHRLGLRRTGTVLLGLTVLLVPILFLVLAWVLPDAAERTVVDWAAWGALGAATLGFGGLSAQRIFGHFLRGTQPTFLVSYLTLALAGALLRGLGESLAPFAALALWAIFAAGAMKVSRHVFWLTEDRRAPRVFGFFPIALLGGQFLAVYLLHAAPHVGLDWFGLGCVLTAIPVLFTADAVARVFQQRTGDLVRPLPWAVLTPLGVGLLLCAAGVCLAAVVGIPTKQTHALLFAAAGAAWMTGLVARRTGKSAFVWAMLVAVTLAYYSTPAFCRQIVDEMMQRGAAAVREGRMPPAFFGLTFFPLFAALMALSVWLARRGNALFAVPMRRYCFGVACLLLGVSLTHPKAIFPVGLALCVLFAGQVVLFRSRLPAIPALLAWVLAAFGAQVFFHDVLELPLAGDFRLDCLLAAAALLLPLGVWLDPLLARLRPALPGTDRLCQLVSLGLALVLAGIWMIHASGAWPTGLLLAVLLLTHALCRQRHTLSFTALLFAQLVFLVEAAAWDATAECLIAAAALAVTVQWLLGYLLCLVPNTRPARTFGLANDVIAFGQMIGLLFLVYLPAYALEIGGLQTVWPHASIACGLLLAALCFDAARRHASMTLTALGCVAVLSWVGAAFVRFAGHDEWRWLPAVWAATAVVALPVAELLRRRRLTALELPITFAALAVLLLAAVGSLVAVPLPMRIAGGLGLVGLLVLSVLRNQPAIRLPALLVVNWQIVSLVLSLLLPGHTFLFDISPNELPILLTPLACVAAASVLAWQAFGNRWALPWSVFVDAHLWVLRVLMALMLLHSLTLPALSADAVALAVTAFVFAAVAEVCAACRNEEEPRVWGAQALIAAAVGYAAWFHVLTFESGHGMYVMLAVALACWIGKEVAARHARLAPLVRPLTGTAYALPLVAVGVGVFRHVWLARTDWLGANSLALLLAGGFYFWRGIEERSKTYVLLAGVILNVALALLWHRLDWNDPQFFMIPIGITVLGLVQLFRAELPERFHDPLRYAGALAILVSPVFRIVDGSWLHLFTLMVASVGVVLLAIGLRVRALMYAGTAFLLADLAAMVVRGSVDDRNVLWIAGLALGAAVLALGAVCERNREVLVQRMRVVAEVLKQWD